MSRGKNSGMARFHSPSRRHLLAGICVIGVPSIVAGMHIARPRPEPASTAPFQTIHVRISGALGNGSHDDSAAFQRALDRLSGGGVLVVDPGTYLVGQLDVRHRNIEVRLMKGAVLRRIGEVGPTSRGMFCVQNLIDAGFKLAGGQIDLNGEGPMGIGMPGRIRNLYASQTIATVKALAGPANAAVYGLRSSGITVSGTQIRNTGETGLLFRNCGDVEIEGCTFRNIANYGVEFSLVPAASDLGEGPMPVRGRCRVRECLFEDIDDYGLGSGNGVGIGGGGSERLASFRTYEVSGCTFRRCQRDIHFEFHQGAHIEDVTLRAIRSFDARQGSFGLVGVRGAVIDDYVITNAGAAPTAAWSIYPEIYGGLLSSEFVDVAISRLRVVDTRRSRVRRGVRGAIRAGSRVFQGSGAGFSANDVGAYIGIAGANPSGVHYVGRILSVESPTRVTLDLPAGASVTNADFSLGGATRQGMVLFHGTSATLRQVEIEAGNSSGLPGEPSAAAMRIDMVNGDIELADFVATAPVTGAVAPSGLLIRNSPRMRLRRGATRIEGFVVN